MNAATSHVSRCEGFAHSATSYRYIAKNLRTQEAVVKNGWLSALSAL